MKFLAFFSLVYSFHLFAHIGASSRGSLFWSSNGNISHGGYGYYYAGSTDISSEASAVNLLEVDCDEAQKEVAKLKSLQLKRCKSGKCDKKPLAVLERQLVEIEDQLDNKIYEKIRLQALEYFALNLKATTKDSSSPFDPKTLLTKGAGGCSVPQGSKLYNALKKPNQNAGRNLAQKQNLINQTFEPLQMARAIIARERMVSIMGVRKKSPGAKEAHSSIPWSKREVTRYDFYDDLGVDAEDGDDDHRDDLNCSQTARAFKRGTGKGSEEQNNAHNMCEAIQSELFRLETNFPALYFAPSRHKNPASFGSDAVDAIGIFDSITTEIKKGKAKDVYRPGLLTGVKELVEANGGSWSESVEAIRFGDIQGFVKLEKNLNNAVIKATSGFYKVPEISAAYEKLKKSSNDVKRSFANYIKRVALPDLCKSTDVKSRMRRIFRFHPNVIRQLMIELKPKERVIAKNLFCKNGFSSYLRKGNQCAGISGGPLPGKKPVKVSRRSFSDFPFQSQNNFEISQKSPSSPRVIKMKLNLIVGPNVSESSANKSLNERFVRKIKEDINKYINCQLGHAPSSNKSYYRDPLGYSHYCDRSVMKKSPGVKVDIQFNLRPRGTKPKKPYMYLHECFRAELVTINGNVDASNCKKVRQFSFDECTSKGNSERYCERVIPPIKNGRLNRANSSNITRASTLGTLRHEILHQIGLSDEYKDKAMPFNPIGEQQSIMRSPQDRYAKLYPHHVSQLLKPLKCTKQRLK